MQSRFAYDEITLEYGSNVVFLRPSLRAAMRLERLHGDFPKLLQKIHEFDTRTVWHIVKESGGLSAARDVVDHFANRPLAGFVLTAQAALFELVAALFPVSSQSQTSSEQTSKPMPWSEAFNELFKIATGWLGWPPETAWKATPQEITDAFEGQIAKLKAIHGSADDQQTDTNTLAKQREQNEALGLDPEFDRAGLHALKGKGTF